MLSFSADELARAANELGMEYPAHVLDQLVAAIDSGKHVVLTGPPGTGKTTLAYLAAEVGQQALLCTGYLPTTATTEWTTFETIGGFQPPAEGLIFGPAVYLDAAKYAARRGADGPTESRLLYEVFYAYFLPQFEGMDDARASQLYRAMQTVLDPPEQAEAERTIMEVLGVEVVG